MAESAPLANRPVRTRMRGAVGAGGEKPPATRFGRTERQCELADELTGRTTWELLVSKGSEQTRRGTLREQC